MPPFDSYLLIEWPRPWPADLRSEPRLAPVVGALGPQGRLHAVVPVAPDSARRVILYRRSVRGDGWFVSFRRRARVVAADDLVDAAVDLVRSGHSNPDTEDGSAIRDLLVCAHGSRDRCCGSRGTQLVNELAGNHPYIAGTTHVWTSSHIGNHYFAPNVMLFPEGTAWGFADASVVGRIVDRRGRVEDVLSHYRGCAGFTAPEVQAVERLAFSEIGWTWLDYTKRGFAQDDGLVRLEAQAPSGEQYAWKAIARPGRRLAIPPCLPPSNSAKYATELLVTNFLRTDDLGESTADSRTASMKKARQDERLAPTE